MTTKIEIAAVGDILMWNRQIESAKISNQDRYDFDPMFREIAPYLKRADLTIGNLETTFSGREREYQKKNPKTGYPLFNCPDELAITLKKAGFDVLTTANNHCMDRGIHGLKRTLRILDRHGISHTGTFASADANRFLIRNVKGVRVGILAYTYGTNYIPVPKEQPWLVNRIDKEKIARDIRKLKKLDIDLVIVALHFGVEFSRFPSQKQQQIVQSLFQSGADIVLGAHPHVIQPIRFKKKFAIYSLGNFISVQMWKNFHTVCGVVLYLTVEKDHSGKTNISGFRYVPTWVQVRSSKNRSKFRVLPIKKFLNKPDSSITSQDLADMKQAWHNTTSYLKSN